MSFSRYWWAFALPESIAWVPAFSEAGAREVLTRNSYQGAPVYAWPLVATRVTTRAALAATNLGTGLPGRGPRPGRLTRP